MLPQFALVAQLQLAAPVLLERLAPAGIDLVGMSPDRRNLKKRFEFS